MKIFDFHRHSFMPDSIFNLITGKDEIPVTGFFTAGIHPWFIDQQIDLFPILEKLSQNKNCIAIGECGIDRLKGAPLEIQIQLFKKQIELAGKLNKPLIIHCVKAHNELLEIKKASGSTVQWIVHGYNQNEIIADRLLEQDFYFSLGKPLLHEESNSSKLLKRIPQDRFFLETDSFDVTIEQIYQAAAERLQLPIQDLVDNLHQNFQKVFKIHA